ncbi:hypothetical protein Tco_1557425, partial [Tanacetum coccineum]
MRINGSGNNSCKLKFKEQSLIDRNPHQHVTRPSTVNPPSDDEKVNAEMAIQIMVEVVALGEMQAIK